MCGVLRGWLVVATAVLCLAAGCTVTGTPVAAPVTSDRPREIRLDGIDPCTLLTEEQKKELGLDRPPVGVTGFDPGYNGVTALCTIRGEQPRAITVGVTLVVNVGIGRYTPDAVRATLTPVWVRGFPGLVVVPNEHPEFCVVVVDVADGQLLDIQFRDGGSSETVPQPDLCAGAEQAADLVMSSLLKS